MVMSQKYLVSVVMVICVCSGTVAKNVHARSVDDNSCENVRQFFAVKNITLGTDITKGSICGGQCCDDNTESLLMKQGQRDFAALLRHNSRSLQGLLTSTAITLQNHVMELTQQSENKTLLLFSNVYRGMAVLSREPIENLYKNIRYYIHINSTDAKPQLRPEDMAKSVTSFFTELFPLAYHHYAGISNKDFTQSYKECLKKSMEAIAPFGDTPKQVAQALSKSLEATRMLLQAFRIGTDVLDTTDSILIDEHSKGNSQCHNALLKMTYCPKCQGLWKHAKPCSGYCLNVLRGCLAKYVADLDLPWNGYMEGIESLLNAIRKSDNEAGVNVDFVIRKLETDISTAIMTYMANAKEIDTRVKMNCGPADFSVPKGIPAALTAPTVTSAATTTPGKQRGPPPLPELPDLGHFLAAVGRTRGFYANLATALCKDETFTEPKDERCWNGERIADYSKTVVDVGLNLQKYNPEVQMTTNMDNADSRVAGLVDKLRRVHHMAVSSLGPNFPDVDYMQRDGTEGSGSGGGPDFDEDERDDDEELRGSGSGDGPGNYDGAVSKSNKPAVFASPPTYDQPPSVVATDIGDQRRSLSLLATLMITLTVTWTQTLFYE